MSPSGCLWCLHLLNVGVLKMRSQRNRAAALARWQKHKEGPQSAGPLKAAKAGSPAGDRAVSDWTCGSTVLQVCCFMARGPRLRRLSMGPINLEDQGFV